MTIKNYSKKFIIWILVITIASCSKYERTNPNDLLGSEGTPTLAIDGYEVISDNNGDAKLQKNETATLNVLVNNTGTKLTQISSAVFTSNSTKLVIENFSSLNTMTCYVGKTNSIGNLRIKVASNATVGETLTCNAKLTDKDGKVFNTTLTLAVSDFDFKPSDLSIRDPILLGLNESNNTTYGYYEKGFTPVFYMEIDNNGIKHYKDYLKITITSLNAAYPYQFSKTNLAEISPGNSFDFEVWLDCFTQNIPSNTNLPLNIAITDNQGRTAEKQINKIIYPSSAKLDFTSFEIRKGGLTPGSLVVTNCIVKNSGGRTLNFLQSGAKISTTSSYLNNLSIQITNGKINPNETTNSLVGFSAAIASNCPKGTKIPITIELTTSETCPTKLTSVVQLDVE